MPYPITCPYCMNTFTPDKVHFRSVDTDPEKLKRDPMLEEYFRVKGSTESAAALPLAYTPDNIRAENIISIHEIPKAYRETPLVTTHKRLCPFCHNRLPDSAGFMEQKMIALTGTSNAGKTVFLLSLMRHMPGLMRGMSWQKDPFIDDGYFGPRYADFVERNLLPDSTQKNAILPPAAYTLAIRRSQNEVKEYCICFYDMAGELLESSSELETRGNFLRAAHGIIFIVDPIGFPGIRQDAFNKELKPRKVALADSLSTIWNITGAKDTHKPFAITITKSDAIRHAAKNNEDLKGIVEDSLVFKEPDHRQGFDIMDHNRVHYECMSFLEANDPGVRNAVQMSSGQMQTFMISALGHMPEAISESQQKIAAYAPIRIVDPVLWILSMLGIFPVNTKPNAQPNARQDARQDGKQTGLFGKLHLLGKRS